MPVNIGGMMQKKEKRNMKKTLVEERYISNNKESTKVNMKNKTILIKISVLRIRALIHN